MTNGKLSRQRTLRASAIGLAVGLLFGCGGGDDDDSNANPQPASVQVTETATILSVRSQTPSSSKDHRFEAQALNYTFAAQVVSGPNAGLNLAGRLQLKGEREDDGVTKVEGRLFPDATPSLPSREDLKTQFEADRKAAKNAMRADIKVLSTQLRADLTAGAVAGSDGPTAAQIEALATFKTAFNLRTAQYRAEMSALVAAYRSAKHDRSAGHNHDDDEDDDDSAARGYEVKGTIDANGAMVLTISLDDRKKGTGKVVVTGVIAADGSASGKQ